MNKPTLFLILAAMVLNVGCWKTVEPGYAGIKVNNHGQQRGVEDFPVQTGRIMVNPITESVYVFPTFKQRIPWTKSEAEGSPNDESITFNSTEGAPINVDVAFAGSFKLESVPSIFVEFRTTANKIVDGWVRDQVRNCMNRAGSVRKAVDILGSGKIAFMDDASSCVQEIVEAKGFEFDSISLLGEARVPNRVKESISQVIEATQAALRANEEVKKKEAEARQVVATANGERLKRIAEAQGAAAAILELANAQAEANKIVAASLTARLIEYKALETWDGALPRFTGGDAIPLINLN